MYGTIARFKAKPEFKDALKAYEGRKRKGYIRSFVYQSDDDPNEYWMAVLFEDKESYDANAKSPEQAKEYEELSKTFLEEPVWHDGTVIYELE